MSSFEVFFSEFWIIRIRSINKCFFHQLINIMYVILQDATAEDEEIFDEEEAEEDAA